MPGRIKWCSSAASAVSLRRGSTTTSLPPRSRSALQPAAHVGRGHQRAVRRQRVRAQHQQVLRAVDVGHGTESGAPNISPAETCFGIWSTVLAE